MIHVKVPLYKSTKGIKVVCFPFPSSVLMRRTKLWCMLLNFILALFYPALLTLNLGQYYNLKTFLAKSLRRLKDGSVVESTICSSRDSEFNFHQPYGGSWIFKEEKILATKQHCEFLVMGKIKYYPYSLLIQDEKNDFFINCHIYWVIICAVYQSILVMKEKQRVPIWRLVWSGQMVHSEENTNEWSSQPDVSSVW